MIKKSRFAARARNLPKFVDVDPDRCTGCGICELVCSLEKSDKKSFNPTKSRIRVLRLHPTTNIAIACRLCEDAPCVLACPQDALVQSKDSGVIIVDENKCNGCSWCIKACKFGSITIEPSKGAVVICDLCDERNGIGVFPGRKKVRQACIEWCPEEALDLITRERLAQKAGEKAAEKFLNDQTKG